MKMAFASFPHPLGSVAFGFITISPVALVVVGAGAVIAACIIVTEQKKREADTVAAPALSVVS